MADRRLALEQRRKALQERKNSIALGTSQLQRLEKIEKQEGLRAGASGGDSTQAAGAMESLSTGDAQSANSAADNGSAQAKFVEKESLNNDTAADSGASIADGASSSAAGGANAANSAGAGAGAGATDAGDTVADPVDAQQLAQQLDAQQLDPQQLDPQQLDPQQLEVVVPDGCHGGDSIAVAAPDGSELIVTIPAGLGPGDRMVVAVPNALSDDELFRVLIPDGCEAGSEILIEAPDGQQLTVVVPDGLRAGDTMEVSVPRKEPPAPAERPPEPERVQQSPEQLMPAKPDAAAGTVRKTTDRVQAPELSDESEDDEEVLPHSSAKYPIGAPVEVLRNDGNWTLAAVRDYDVMGGSYTIELADNTGRLKYFVEAAELRIPRFLLLTSGNI